MPVLQTFASMALIAGSSSLTSDGPPSEVFMDKTAGKRRGLAGFDPQGCGRFLRTLYPTKTAGSIAADTRIPAKTVERWLAEDAEPRLGAFAVLVAVYGPAFLAASMPGLQWVEHAAALATHEGMTREIERLDRERAIVARRLGFGGDRS